MILLSDQVCVKHFGVCPEHTIRVGFKPTAFLIRRPFAFPGKRYNLADVSAAICMSLGLIWFTLADSKLAPNFNLTGDVYSDFPF